MKKATMKPKKGKNFFGFKKKIRKELEKVTSIPETEFLEDVQEIERKMEDNQSSK